MMKLVVVAAACCSFIRASRACKRHHLPPAPHVVRAVNVVLHHVCPPGGIAVGSRLLDRGALKPFEPGSAGSAKFVPDKYKRKCK